MKNEPFGTIPVYRTLDAIPAGFGPSIASIGNFDGVHLGHQQILKAAVAEGTLEPGRLASHVKLQRELAFLERKQEKRAQAEHKKKYQEVNLAKRTQRYR